MEVEFAPRGGTRLPAGVSIRCRRSALTGRQNTDNNQMHGLRMSLSNELAPGANPGKVWPCRAKTGIRSHP